MGHLNMFVESSEMLVELE